MSLSSAELVASTVPWHRCSSSAKLLCASVLYQCQPVLKLKLEDWGPAFTPEIGDISLVLRRKLTCNNMYVLRMMHNNLLVALVTSFLNSPTLEP